MPVTKLLIAIRGEIARAAVELGLPTVAVHSEDDARARHMRVADAVQALPGEGPAAYLNAEAVITAPKATGCDGDPPRLRLSG